MLSVLMVLVCQCDVFVIIVLSDESRQRLC